MAFTQAQAQALIEQSMIGGVPTATFNANGGYDAVRALATSNGWGGGSPTVGSILKYGSTQNADGSGNLSYMSGNSSVFDHLGSNPVAAGYDGATGNNYYDEAIKAAALNQSNLGKTLDQIDWGSPNEDQSVGSSYSAPSAPQQPKAQAYRNSYGGGRNQVVDYRQPNMDAAYTADDWQIWDTPTDEPGGSNFNFAKPAAASASSYGTSGADASSNQAWDWQQSAAPAYSAPQSWDARSQSRSSATPWF